MWLCSELTNHIQTQFRRIFFTFFWFHPTAEAMVRKQLTQFVLDLIVEKYESGGGVQKNKKFPKH